MSCAGVCERSTPSYRHHFLLLESANEKLAKLHGSIPFSALRAAYSGPALCGILAHAANLIDAPRDVTPADLVASFDWERVPTEDRLARFVDGRLVIARYSRAAMVDAYLEAYGIAPRPSAAA